MAAPIGPGDWVECVDAAGTLEVGAIYQVREFNPDPLPGCRRDGCRKPGFAVHGARPSPGMLYFCPNRFKPIWRGDKSLIQTLLEPIKEDTCQPEHA